MHSVPILERYGLDLPTKVLLNDGWVKTFGIGLATLAHSR